MTTRVDLTSGAWVDLRDKLNAGDKFAAQDAAKLNVRNPSSNDDPGQAVTQSTGGFANQMRRALLARIIEAWSFEGIAIPANNPGVREDPEAVAALFAEVFDLDDWNDLEDATEDVLLKVMRRGPNRRNSSA